MKIKKSFLILISLICILIIPTYGLSQSSEELFNTIRRHYKKNFPKDFVATVSGNEIKRSLTKIPKDVYCKGKKPKVTYLFLKGEEESIIVEHVENPYVTRFQPHLEVYKGAKSFLDSKKSYSELKKIYYWEFNPRFDQRKRGQYFVVKMRKHRIRKSDYLLLYFDKENYSLKEAVQYSNGKKIGSVKMTYKRVDRYYLPFILKFRFLKNRKKKRLTFKISNYRINVGLTSDQIIELQDDCPSLNR